MNATKSPSARKTLSDQLDRLDGILDGLAEALDESVADAVRAAAKDAVAAAVRSELARALSEPEFLGRLGGRHAPRAAGHETPSLLLSKVRRMKQQGHERLSRLRSGLRDRSAALAGRCRGWLSALWSWRKPAAVALSFGLILALMAYLAGPVVASAAVGLGCAVASFRAAPRLGVLPDRCPSRAGNANDGISGVSVVTTTTPEGT